MRRLWTVGLVPLALLAPSAAHACTIAIWTDRLGEERDEATLRTDLARDARAETRRLRNEARAGLADGSAAHARALVASMVPAPVQVQLAPCAGMVISSPYRDYALARAAVEAAAGDGRQVPPEEFAAAYAVRIRPCTDEFRGRLADYLVARIAPGKLARVWHEVHRLGFDLPGTGWHSLYFLYPGPPPDLRLPESMTMVGYAIDADDHPVEQAFWARRNRENWARLSRFLAEDADAIELAAVLEAGLVELGDPALPFAGLCPQTTAPLAEFVASAIENARPLKPTVEVVFDLPDSAGS